MKYKGIAKYCTFSHCKHWDKCTLRLNDKVKQQAKGQGSEPEIRENCVYLDHNFEKREK